MRLLSFAASPLRLAIKPFVPLRAMVPRLLSSSASSIPMPLSPMLSVLASLSIFISMRGTYESAL